MAFIRECHRAKNPANNSIISDETCNYHLHMTEINQIN